MTLALAALVARPGAAQVLAPDPADASLDCTHVDAATVAQLARGPAPRVVLLQGSVPLVTMEPFARFLVAMGYPAAALADPADGSLSRSSYGDPVKLAGILARFYEVDGLRPMLIGHSQGGALVVRALHALAGRFGPVDVRDPATGASLSRDTIVDPRTGVTRPVVGLSLAFAAALATGALPRVLLLQWTTLPLLRRIPDTVDEFAGYRIPGDPIAGDWLGDPDYRALGSAKVRNVVLPEDYHHVTLPEVEPLAHDPSTRAWIDGFRVDAPPREPPQAADTRNLAHAADLWDAVRRHWCEERKVLASPRAR